MTVTVRKAQNGDISAVLRLLEQVGQVHHHIRPDIFRPDARKYDEAALCQIFSDPMKPVFVAEGDDGVEGYCFCVHKSCTDHPIFNDRSELYIDDLCVDAESRGSGVAEALFRHAQGYAQASGCGVITLNVWCGNGRAMAFYEKMGLTPRNITMELPLEDTGC